jgi:hypothetical protein
MPTYATFGGWVISTIAGWFVVTADTLQDEINVRHQRMLARRRKSADFREPRSLEN